MAKRKVTKHVDDDVDATDASETIAREQREHPEPRTVRKPGDGARMLSAEEVAELQREESNARAGDEPA